MAMAGMIVMMTVHCPRPLLVLGANVTAGTQVMLGHEKSPGCSGLQSILGRLEWSGKPKRHSHSLSRLRNLVRATFLIWHTRAEPMSSVWPLYSRFISSTQ